MHWNKTRSRGVLRHMKCEVRVDTPLPAGQGLPIASHELNSDDQIKLRILTHESGWSGSTSSPTGVGQQLSKHHSSMSPLVGTSYHPASADLSSSV